jgi:NTP pyrophosphatase (non-canonical NTP hydrolase)
MSHDTIPESVLISVAANQLVESCHQAAATAGWWGVYDQDNCPWPEDVTQVRKNTRLGKLLVSQKIALCHSELSEALEGARKDKMDDHLPHFTSVAVELADAVIRICDLAGAMNISLGRAIAEKMAYNAQRADHKPENRAAAGGKAF